MKCIAAIEVQFDESPIGTRSRLTDKVQGRPVLTRTVEQLAHVERLDHIFVICPPDEAKRSAGYIPDELSNRVTVRSARVASAPFSQLVRTARKWSLDGWRGGIGGVCSMDEYTRTDELAILAHEESADALFCASAAAPLLDPALADEMIEHADRTSNESRVTFAQAPPGLVGTVYETSFLIEMGRKHIPPGMVLSYKPDAPMMDLAHKTCCYVAPPTVRHAAGRLIADTDRSFATVDEYLATGQPIDAAKVGQWLINRFATQRDSLPREVEIELTTEDQLSNTILRPRGQSVGRRGPLKLDLIAKIAAELATFDDSLVVLGGFGEPLLHPQFAEIVHTIRDAGVYGLALRTNGLALDDRIINSIIDAQIEVVSVTLDAWTPELYRTVHAIDGLSTATAGLRRLIELRTKRQSVCPLVVPEMVKSRETLGEVDAFFDGWVRETGWAIITGYCHFARDKEDRSVVNMAPPTRVGCRRLNRRAMVLADGRLVICDQDFTGKHAVGSLGQSTLSDLWAGKQFESLRSSHREGRLDGMDLCARCDEWHRG